MIRATSGNSLTSAERNLLKSRLVWNGWFQNEYEKWENPIYPSRTGAIGFTLFSAARKEKLIQIKKKG